MVGLEAVERFNRYIPHDRYGVRVDPLSDQMLRFAQGSIARYRLDNALGISGNDAEALELVVAQRHTDQTFSIVHRRINATAKQIHSETQQNLTRIILGFTQTHSFSQTRLDLIRSGANAILDHMEANPVKGVWWRRPTRRRVEAFTFGIRPRTSLKTK